VNASPARRAAGPTPVRIDGRLIDAPISIIWLWWAHPYLGTLGHPGEERATLAELHHELAH